MTNDTLRSANSTVPPVPRDSATGLAVGLSLLLLFVLVAVALACKLSSKIWTALRFGEKRRQKNVEVAAAEEPQSPSQRYCSLDTEPPAGQQPIYENLNTQPGGNKERPASTVSPKRSVIVLTFTSCSVFCL